MTSTFASSDDPFSFMNTLQFVVHVDWILLCFLRKRASLAVSPSSLSGVRSHICWFPSAFSPAWTVHSQIIMAGLCWHPLISLLSMDMLLLSKKVITCCSRETSSGSEASPLTAAVALTYNQCRVSSPLIIQWFMYYSRSATQHSMRLILLFFLLFCLFSSLTSPIKPIIIFCLEIVAISQTCLWWHFVCLKQCVQKRLNKVCKKDKSKFHKVSQKHHRPKFRLAEDQVLTTAGWTDIKLWDMMRPVLLYWLKYLCICSIRHTETDHWEMLPV